MNFSINYSKTHTISKSENRSHSPAWTKIIVLMLTIYVSHVATYNLKEPATPYDMRDVELVHDYDRLKSNRMARKPSSAIKH